MSIHPVGIFRCLTNGSDDARGIRTEQFNKLVNEGQPDTSSSDVMCTLSAGELK